MVLAAPALRAQDGSDAGGARQGRGGQFAGMQRINGEVTAVSGTTLSVKTLEGGTVQVTTTENTRAMKAKLDGSGQPAPIKVADIKVGDGVMAAGNLDAPNKTLHAAILVATDAEQVKALKENLGKTYIVGKVTAIDLDNAKLTVQRSDGVTQTIGLDETTSFRRGRAGMNFGGGPMGGGGGRQGAAAGGAPPAESITLADIKVGDEVGGRGSVKDGVFVPAELTVGTPGQRRQRPATPDAGTPPQ